MQGKNSKISHILVFCMRDDENGMIQNDEGCAVDFYFIFYCIIGGWGQVILARLEINSSLFSFHPSENWIGSSISPDEGGSSADSYYLLKFFSLIQSLCHPRFNLELNLVFETFSFTRIACQLSNKSFPYFYP